MLLRPENAETMNSLVKELQSVKNMRTIMIGLRKGISSGFGKGSGFSTSVWAGVRQVCDSVVDATPVLLANLYSWFSLRSML